MGRAKGRAKPITIAAINDSKIAAWRIEAILKNRPKVAGGPTAGEKNHLRAAVDALQQGPALKEATRQVKLRCRDCRALGRSSSPRVGEAERKGGEERLIALRQR